MTLNTALEGLIIVALIVGGHFVYEATKIGGSYATNKAKSASSWLSSWWNSAKNDLANLKGDVATLKSDMAAVKSKLGLSNAAPAPAAAPSANPPAQA